MENQTITQDQFEEILKKETQSENHLYKDYGVTTEDKIFTETFFHQGDVALSFKNCIFKEKFSFSSFFPTADLYLTECIFQKGLYFGNISSGHKIVFLNCSINETAIFSETNIPNLELNLRYAKEIIFADSSVFSNIIMGGMERNKIDKLSLNAGIIDKRFEINHADIGAFWISRSTLESELLVANCNINKLNFDNFRNNGFLKFLNCRSLENNQPSELEINQSNMGKVEFFKFNFASFISVNITNSVIFESIFINSKWSKHNMISREVHFTTTLETSNDSKKEVRADNLKDVYKQIKYALYKQGDYVQEQFFHGLEMNEYYKTLTFKRGFWTKIILKLSFWTSDFGQSFLRPITSILIVNSLLFYVMFRLGATKFTSLQIFNFNNYPDTVASLLNFMNPLHKTEPALIGLPFIIDTFSRIFSSYFIYNTIRATRRFVK
jgi:hypothetical protein